MFYFVAFTQYLEMQKPAGIEIMQEKQTKYQSILICNKQHCFRIKVDSIDGNGKFFGWLLYPFRIRVGASNVKTNQRSVLKCLIINGVCTCTVQCTFYNTCSVCVCMFVESLTGAWMVIYYVAVMAHVCCSRIFPSHSKTYLAFLMNAIPPQITLQTLQVRRT